MIWTDNPVRDAAAYFEEMSKINEDDYPVCEICGDHILPDDTYGEMDGYLFHRGCIGWQRMKTI